MAIVYVDVDIDNFGGITKVMTESDSTLSCILLESNGSNLTKLDIQQIFADEANIWGTNKQTFLFCNLNESRIYLNKASVHSKYESSLSGAAYPDTMVLSRYSVVKSVPAGKPSIKIVTPALKKAGVNLYLIEDDFVGGGYCPIRFCNWRRSFQDSTSAYIPVQAGGKTEMYAKTGDKFSCLAADFFLNASRTISTSGSAKEFVAIPSHATKQATTAVMLNSHYFGNLEVLPVWGNDDFCSVSGATQGYVAFDISNNRRLPDLHVSNLVSAPSNSDPFDEDSQQNIMSFRSFINENRIEYIDQKNSSATLVEYVNVPITGARYARAFSFTYNLYQTFNVGDKYVLAKDHKYLMCSIASSSIVKHLITNKQAGSASIEPTGAFRGDKLVTYGIISSDQLLISGGNVNSGGDNITVDYIWVKSMGADELFSYGYSYQSTQSVSGFVDNFSTAPTSPFVREYSDSYGTVLFENSNATYALGRSSTGMLLMKFNPSYSKTRALSQYQPTLMAKPTSPSNAMQYKQDATLPTITTGVYSLRGNRFLRPYTSGTLRVIAKS